MKLFKLFIALLACFTLLTGCAGQTEEEKQLAEIRNQASKYSFLVAGRQACTSITGMLGYYDNASYQRAKEEAVYVSEAIRAEYFPTVNWQGAEVLTQKQVCNLVDLTVSSYTDKNVVYLAKYTIGSGRFLPRECWYSVTYSLKSNEITELELICSY